MTAEPRVLLFDLETTNLSADFGFILCIGYKWLGDPKIYCPSIDQSPGYARNHTDDTWLLEKFRPVVEDADILVAHYGSRFDRPYLQARALFNGLPPFPALTPLVDTWRIAREKLALSSNRLLSVSNLIGAPEKTPLVGRIWVRAMHGDKKAIKYVKEHCLQDIIVLEKVYQAIAPLRTGPPHMNVKGGCPSCGGFRVQSRGRVKTLKSVKQRYSCNECGHWFQI